ncbi:MAG: hypothetical protein JO180_05630 [Gemmatirosa sp.]|nr:hypothetical protein [Gemmatirosa sp.]
MSISTIATPRAAGLAGLGALLLALAACSGTTDPVSVHAPAAPQLAKGSGGGGNGGGGNGGGGAASGNKTCGTFSIRLANGQVVSGKQKVSLAGVSGVATVQGTFVRFTVDLGTFKVTDYALRGTTLFARKEAMHGQTLTRPLDVDLNNEQLVIKRTSTNGTLDMKIQAKDCDTGGLFQMEAESDVAATTPFEHELAAGLSYFDPDPTTSRTFFSANGTRTGASLGYDSPELATRTFPALGAPVSGSIARYAVQNGGRMGMVVGEDAREGLLTP